MTDNLIQGKSIPPTQLAPLVDDASVKEVYADNFVGLNFNHGNLNLVFAVTRGDHTKMPPTNHRQLAERLVLPASVAIEFHAILGQIIADMEAKGVITKVPLKLNVVQ
jgi:hypothetical protein